jgi:hypothetical protein
MRVSTTFRVCAGELREKGLAHRPAKPSAEPQQLGSFFRSPLLDQFDPLRKSFSDLLDESGRDFKKFLDRSEAGTA